MPHSAPPFDLDRVAAEYDRNGIVRIRGLIAPEEVQSFREELMRYIHEDLPALPPDACTYEADGTTVRNLWRLERYHPAFRERVERDDLVALAARLVHGAPELAAVETFNKPARVGSAVPFHQDNAYFCRTPPDMLTIWIALDPVTEKNGPVYYVRGSHRQMLPAKPSGVVGNSMGLAEQPAAPRSQLYCGLLDPGDALIHHCQVIHRSDANRSDQPRLGLLLVYRGAHTKVDPALKVAYDAANQ